MTLIDFWKSAWVKIKSYYNEGRICSERHLQAELFKIFLSDKEFIKKYMIHIEPTIYSDKKDRKERKITGIKPDILITEGPKIVAYVELKYVPNTYIQYEKDIHNFSKIYSHRGKDTPIYLKVNPINGDWNYEEKYTFDKDLILIYAMIINIKSDFITNRKKIWSSKEYLFSEEPRYLYLIGIINNKTSPKFFIEPT
jgi:hypothetical protein